MNSYFLSAVDTIPLSLLDNLLSASVPLVACIVSLVRLSSLASCSFPMKCLPVGFCLSCLRFVVWPSYIQIFSIVLENSQLLSFQIVPRFCPFTLFFSLSPLQFFTNWLSLTQHCEFGAISADLLCSLVLQFSLQLHLI